MSFIDEVQFEYATIADVDFILDTIIEAEKSSSDIITSCLVFNLTEKEFRSILTTLLLEGFEDYEYSLNGFLIAKHHKENIGALGSWIEGKNDYDSSIIKANSLFAVMEGEKLSKLRPNFESLQGASFQRSKGALQLEYAYVRPAWRRRGVFTKLIFEQINRYKAVEPKLQLIESFMFKENFRSFNCLHKLKFKVVHSIDLKGRPSEKFFPYSERAFMQFKMNISKGVFEFD